MAKDTAEEMITLDAAADHIIDETRASAQLLDRTEYGVHRAAESEAWANAQRAGEDAAATAAWTAIAGKISEKYQDGVRKAKSKK